MFLKAIGFSMVFIALIAVGCLDQPKAKAGDKVAVDYLGTLENGTVFDTSIKEEAEKAKMPARPSYAPLEFTVGAGQMIKGFDEGVVDMRVGDEKTITIAPADAYGEYQEGALMQVPISQLTQARIQPQVGMQLGMPNGRTGTIKEVNKDYALIDLNHELAGKTLVFKIIMRKIN